jgi:predicted acetyltransferase
VRSLTYRGGEPVGSDEKLIRSDCFAHVAELDGRIVGSSIEIDMRVTRFEDALRCAGVASVGVLPEFRRAGIGGQMMREVLLQCRAQGFALAQLYAFRSGYYRRFGYEHAGTCFEITCPTHRLPRIRSDLHVYQLERERHSQIRGCYESFARRHNGMNLRGDEQWRQQLGGETPFTVYAAGDPVQAYVAVRLNPDFWERQVVREFVWSTPEGYRAGLELLASLGLNKTELQWDEPSDGPFRSLHMEQGVTARAWRPAMFRVLDVPRALSSLRSPKPARFTLEVEDEAVPANRGPWLVETRREGAEVSRCDSATLRMDICALTQAFLGDPSLADLIEQGRVACASDSERQAMLAAMPPHHVCSLDLF